LCFGNFGSSDGTSSDNHRPTCRNPNPDPDPVDVETTYLLRITVATAFDTKLIELVAFDEVVEELIGCSAAQFVEHLSKKPELLSITQGQFVGLRCDITARDEPKPGKHDRKIIKLIPNEPWVPIAHLVMPILPNVSPLVNSRFKVKNFLLDPNFQKQKRDKSAF